MRVNTIALCAAMILVGGLSVVPVQAQNIVVGQTNEAKPMLKYCPANKVSVLPGGPCVGQPGNPGGSGNSGVTVSNCGSGKGCYSQLAIDTVFSGVAKAALSQKIHMAAPGWVYIESDGRVYPSGGRAVADMWITVDGNKSSNESIVDWSKTTNGQQHSYNTIGAVYLYSGDHVIDLVASSLNSKSFTLGSDSNLDVLVNVAPNVKVANLSNDTEPFNFNTNGLGAKSILPTSPVITAYAGGLNASPAIVLASARAYEYGHAGDPLLTITVDGASLANNFASWTDNDMYSGAENQAPFFAQAYITEGDSLTHSIALSASELPYSGGLVNDVEYKIGAGSKLIVIQGMSILGSAATSNDVHNVGNYICVGSSQGWKGCPDVGESVPIAQGDIMVPQGSNGVVLVTGKTRIQADKNDTGGTAYLYLEIDGKRVGSMGVQQLHYPDSVSTRTLSTSFVTSGPNALDPGLHHVVLYGKVSGSFVHASMTRDLPLVWFN